MSRHLFPLSRTLYSVKRLTDCQNTFTMIVKLKLFEVTLIFLNYRPCDISRLFRGSVHIAFHIGPFSRAILYEQSKYNSS